MAFQIQPPNPFNFKHPDNWPKWKQRFEQYFHASGLAASKDKKRQVSTLLYCLGEDAEDVLSSTNISSELSLAKAMKLVRQNEAVKQHTNQLQDHPTTRQSADVATINKRPLLLHKKSSRSYKYVTESWKMVPNHT